MIQQWIRPHRDTTDELFRRRTSGELTNPRTTAAGGPIGGRELARRGAVAVALSVVVNWIVLQAVLAGELVEPFDALNVPPVTLLTALGAVGATVVYGAITRFSDAPDRKFTIVAAVVLVLSFQPNLALLQVDPAATAGAVVVLMVMHATVAAICVAVLTELRRPFTGGA